MKKTNQLFTVSNIINKKPLQEHPRPMMVRSNYMNFNGEWDYKIIHQDDESNYQNLDSYDGKIIVPYPIESFLSNVNKKLKKDEYIYYHLEINNLINEEMKEQLLLHFDAIDQIANIYWNGEKIGEHKGGYLPFTCIISKKRINEKNDLVVIVQDNHDLTYPVGKQSNTPGGIWYTNVSGIWKTVWGEWVNQNYIQEVQITPVLEDKQIHIEVINEVEEVVNVKVMDENKVIQEVTSQTNSFDITFDSVHEWSPEDPFLYRIIIETESDKIESYFAFRKIDIQKINGHSVLCLNNKPYFFHGLLDQGFFPDGIYTPYDYKVMEQEILKLKELGFNTLRKHIKIEHEYWYYLCDKLGMIVWQDMVNNGKYNFFQDSVFPTLGLQKKKKDAPKMQKNEFIQETYQTINSLYNHPSIVLWTIFNEGWGQFEDLDFMKQVKSIDKTRIYDVASGWFNTPVVNQTTDIISKHIYFKTVEFQNNTSEFPLVLSEFGGYSHLIENHHYCEKQYGYGTFKTLEDLNKAFSDLYFNQIIPQIKNGLCATIYTQVSDVEEEINGIFTYDRKVTKINQAIAKNIKETIQREFNSNYESK